MYNSKCGRTRSSTCNSMWFDDGSSTSSEDVVNNDCVILNIIILATLSIIIGIRINISDTNTNVQTIMSIEIIISDHISIISHVITSIIII